MKKKNLIIVISAIAVLLIAIASTYAYYEIQRNHGSSDVTLTSKVLRIEHIDDNVIELTKVLPGQVLIKKFSVKNTGTNDIEYKINLEDVLNELTRNSDLVYTLSNGTDNLVTDEEFPTTDTTIATDIIKPNETISYELTITYKNLNNDQSIDMNKNIHALIQIATENQASSSDSQTPNAASELSYSNPNTECTTVECSLNELFDLLN